MKHAFEETIDLAFDCYKNKQYRQAMDYYHLAMAQDEKSHRPYHGLGDCLTALNQFPDAIENYKKACNLQPSYFRSYLNMGAAYYLQTAYDEAIPLLEKALELNPEIPQTHEYLGFCHYRTGKLDQAIEHISKALEFNPGNINNLCMLHRLLAVSGQTGPALSILYRLCRACAWPEVAAKDYDFRKEPWFVKNIGTFDQCLGRFKGKEGMSFLEIGSFEGMSTCWMLDKILTADGARICTIDPQYQPPFRDNIRKSGQSHKVRIIDDFSQNVLFDFQDESFDFIFNDGWHVGSQVLLDALMSWPLLKTGGIYIFDDYLKEDESRLGQTVKLGVDLFRALFKGSHREIHSGRQLGLEKLDQRVPQDLTGKLATFLTLLEPPAAPFGGGDSYRACIGDFRSRILENFKAQWPYKKFVDYINQLNA